jgi:hypothetical protein
MTISVISDACRRCEGSEDGKIFRNLIDIPTHMTNEEYEKNWYDTNVSWFGTKWDVDYASCGFEFSENEIIMQPETAWSPPIQFLENLVKQYKGIEAYIFYSEPGVGFSGETKIWKDEEGNVIVDDNEYPYLEGIYLLDKEMFWGEVESYIDNFECENDREEDEEGNELPYDEMLMLDYVNEHFDFVTKEDKDEIFKQLKEWTDAK